LISLEPKYTDEPTNFVEAIGRNFFNAIYGCGRALIIMMNAFLAGTQIVKRRSQLGRQMFIIGIKSFAVTEIVALFTGMILALQAGIEMSKYGQEDKIGIIVSQTMCREMGPFMTALILAASVGSAMAAELGTMKVSEEIDALEIMGIDPVRYLVMPRLYAMMIMTPILVIFTNVVGILGGGLVASTQLDVSLAEYYNNFIQTIGNKDIYVGLFKAFVFGIIVATISCYQGLATTNGAIGVGKATRQAVVLSFLLVLIVGYFITWMFY
jgi:phospholipid/cholesterol/gamma-HCH transport system permease protein